MLGPVKVAYALAVGEVDPWQLADDVLLPMPVVYSPGTGHLPGAGSRLEVLGAEVSSLRRRDGRLELRLFNPSASTTAVSIARHRGSFVDLQGEELGRWDGSFELGPWKIANVRLEALTLD